MYYDYNKIFCKGSRELTYIIDSIKYELHVHTAYNLSDLDAYYGQSTASETPLINPATRAEWFIDHGYKEVTPEQFKIAWFGAFGKIGCKGSEDFVKILDKLKSSYGITSEWRGDGSELMYVLEGNVVSIVKDKACFNYPIVSPNDFYSYTCKYLESQSSIVESHKKSFLEELLEEERSNQSSTQELLEKPVSLIIPKSTTFKITL
jgi:hypothetical protein